MNISKVEPAPAAPESLSRPLNSTEEMLVDLARKDERKKISRDVFTAGAVAGGAMARRLSSDEDWREWLKAETDRRYGPLPEPAPAAPKRWRCEECGPVSASMRCNHCGRPVVADGSGE